MKKNKIKAENHLGMKFGVREKSLGRCEARKDRERSRKVRLESR